MIKRKIITVDEALKTFDVCKSGPYATLSKSGDMVYLANTLVNVERSVSILSNLLIQVPVWDNADPATLAFDPGRCAACYHIYCTLEKCFASVLDAPSYVLQLGKPLIAYLRAFESYLRHHTTESVASMMLLTDST